MYKSVSKILRKNLNFIQEFPRALPFKRVLRVGAGSLFSFLLLFILTGGQPSAWAQNLDNRYPGSMYAITQDFSHVTEQGDEENGAGGTEKISDSYPLSYQSIFSLQPPEHDAPIAMLLELNTGSILYGENILQEYPPASLTKLFTVYTALDIYEELGVQMDDTARFSSAAWAENAPPRSSLMFLGPDQAPSIREIILGLMVSSGNDAAMAIAETSTGSMEGFMLRMNRIAEQLGLEASRFVEPSGYSENNRTSAMDLARLTQLYLERWPWVIQEFHMVESFTYPRREHMLNGATAQFMNITQYNRNGLISSYEGATGLKTGYIDESGYNIIATARRDGMHLFALVMGVQADNSVEGSRLREEAARSLLDYGFENFTRVELPLAEGNIPVRRGEAENLVLKGETLEMIVPVNTGDITVERRRAAALAAPVAEDQIVDRFRWIQNGRVVGEYAREAGRAIPRSRGIRASVQSIGQFFRRIFTGERPLEGDIGGFSGSEL
ncbi:D-alanyl-D-alanine carboxypeptidase family protein [Salinispira pacifica]|uniref:D-alanyl-D-alanine carboxypeptidase n=1 Tax=Salinispira pacifica TaxID=1307761 RepID=V5WHQ1_9SPIO|nr:D-alanyl-D-alanine carboxypeptidase family protein [Salinispira pacifica]AHC15054.1 D-alanyl-D-alanine carboxypeptidase [Salinispira pacifica]